MEFFTTGSGYTNKNKFIIVKEMQYYYRFQFNIVIYQCLYYCSLTSFWSETFLNCYFRKSFTTALFCLDLILFSFYLIDLDPAKHRIIDRNKENIIFLLIQELIILYSCFRFSAICFTSSV